MVQILFVKTSHFAFYTRVVSFGCITWWEFDWKPLLIREPKQCSADLATKVDAISDNDQHSNVIRSR